MNSSGPWRGRHLRALELGFFWRPLQDEVNGIDFHAGQQAGSPMGMVGICWNMLESQPSKCYLGMVDMYVCLTRIGV